MFSVKNTVQNIKLIELWGKNLVPLHFVIPKNNFFSDFSHRAQCYSSGDSNSKANDNILNFSW